MLFCSLIVHLMEQVQPYRRSEAQVYQASYPNNQNPLQSVYQQPQQINNQKWAYSLNPKQASYTWYWNNNNNNNNNRPTNNFYGNVHSSDSLADWSCGRTGITNRFSRIMGGQDAVPHSYPWMVSLAKRSMNNLHLCGGVLITRRHVLTAAHCMEDFDGVRDLSILAGIHNINEKNNPLTAIAMTIHPNYDPDTFANDIAILTLATPIPANDPRVGIICLPPDDARNSIYPPLKSSGVAIGWGSTYFGGNPSTTLKQVILPVLEVNKWPCNMFVTYAQGQLCAGQLSGGVDTCQADSGGPLMIENSNNRWEVIGITSFGKSW